MKSLRPAPGSDAGFVHLVLKEGVNDPDGRKAREDARRDLGLDTGEVRRTRVFWILYDLDGDDLARFAASALRDEIVHDVHVNRFHRPEGFASFILVAKAPGVTDDEGASAQTALADFLGAPPQKDIQRIFTQDLYLVERALSSDTLARLAEDLLGNALIHHFEYGPVAQDPRYVPVVLMEADATTEELDLEISDAALLALSRSRVLSLNLEEMCEIRDHYRDPGVRAARDAAGLPGGPTDCELEVFAQTWSEHCKHKEFQAEISYRDQSTGETRVIDSLFKTYIRGATDRVRETLEAAGEDWLVKVFSDNAGMVRIDDERLFVWKVETHNTPSALDPYGGAITGILGNNRDPLGTGRGGGRLLFNTNVLCFGPPDFDGVLFPGQLHPMRIFAGVRHGIEDGGNKSGIPTVNGSIIFDDRYRGKPLVYCGTGSVMPMRLAGRDSSVKEVLPGDRIVMGGGRVGKDGIHGATFSSAEIDKHSPKTAVQIGSPITQKLLADFMEDASARGLLRCTTDNGAGGLASSIGELAPLAGGARVDLEKVPLKYAGIRPWEIFVSESQERMTYIVDPAHMAPLLDLADQYEVELTDIGVFDDSGAMSVSWEGQPVARWDLEFLHEGVPRRFMEAEWTPPTAAEPDLPEQEDYTGDLMAILGSWNVCSREWVIRQYDHEVKGKTIVKPLMGPRGRAPQDAAVMRVGFDGWQGLAISNGICPKFGDLDAYEMSAGAFDEGVRQIVAVGGRIPTPGDGENRFWSVNDNFCVPDSLYDPRTNPDGKYKLAQLVRMCEALYDLSTFFSIPMTSGKDSMKNDFRGEGVKISVPPTILYSMTAKMADVRAAITSDLKAAGDRVYRVGTTWDELGGSEFYRLHGHLGANVPRVRRETARALYLKVQEATGAGLVQSCHDLSDGGLAVALAETAFGGGFGVEGILDPGGLSAAAQLFSESHSRFVVSVRPEDADRFEAILGDDARLLGEVTEAPRLILRCGESVVVDAPVDDLFEAWSRGVEV
ncbi:MAG: AIR synthase-related protein [Pseudomonadota bacterium]